MVTDTANGHGNPSYGEVVAHIGVSSAGVTMVEYSKEQVYICQSLTQTPNKQ